MIGIACRDAEPTHEDASAVSRGRSDAELFPATPDRLPQVAQLVLDRLADRLASRLEILLHTLLDLFARDAVPHLLATLRGPARATHPLAPGPHRAAPGAAHDGRDGAMAARPATQQRRRADADEQPDQRRRQEIVLLFT